MMTMTHTPALLREVNWTDLYKLTMGQAVWRKYPGLNARYLFINRGQNLFPTEFRDELMWQIEAMNKLQVSEQTLHWMALTIPGLSLDWLNWYADFRFNPDEVRIDTSEGELRLRIEGPWHRAIYWETPLLSLISNLYNRLANRHPALNWREEAYQRGVALQRMGARYIEFGARRAYSPEVHEESLQELIVSSGSSLMGTSNVALARKYGLKPMGTFAHEWVMAHAGMYGYAEANRAALQAWHEVYQGAYATALTDTFTTEVFLRTYDRSMIEWFPTVRQDSGDPLWFADRMIAHYEAMGVDPLTITIIFSDNLNVPAVQKILEYCRGRINVMFGIGTDLTNNITGLPSLNVVMKLVGIQQPTDTSFREVVKLSDAPFKVTGNSEAVAQARRELGI